MQFDQFKTKFIEEALSLIDQLEDSLLNQEFNPDNMENIQHIFRVMHTLKGVSSMYGFNHISELSHKVESIFDSIRDKKQQFTEDLLNLTLKTVDHFRNLLGDEELKIEKNKLEQQQLLTLIDQTIGIEIKVNSSFQPVSPKSNSLFKTFYIIFYTSENLLFRGINILRMFEELADLGEYRIINHSFIETKSEESELAWGIYLVTNKGAEAIEDVFMFVLDDCRIIKVSDCNLFNFNDFNVHINALTDEGNKTVAGQFKEIINQTIDDINSTLPKQPEAPQKSETVVLQGSKYENEFELFKADKSKYTLPDVAESPIINNNRINIDATKLDRLMYLVSELVITNSQLNKIIENQQYHQLVNVAEKIDHLSRNFRDNALSIRLVKVAEMVLPLKRMVHDISKTLGKEVKFLTQGIETELDKNIIDQLSEPIMHILRNCVDHGIETTNERLARNKTPYGVIKFTSFYLGANVFIQIQDDGAGIDPEKIKKKAIEKGLIAADTILKEKEIHDLIFLPGFSTAEKVTEVSGRGVGMDVVRRKIAEVRGEVEVNSEVGLGTFFTIKLHQTMSIIDTLLLRVDDIHYMIPISDVEYCGQENHDDLYKGRKHMVEHNGELIPFISLRDELNHKSPYPDKEKLVVISRNDLRVAILVDKIIGEHQAVLKALGHMFANQKILSGVSLLGDGQMAFMLDTNAVLKLVGL